MRRSRTGRGAPRSRPPSTRTQPSWREVRRCRRARYRCRVVGGLRRFNPGMLHLSTKPFLRSGHGSASLSLRARARVIAKASRAYPPPVRRFGVRGLVAGAAEPRVARLLRATRAHAQWEVQADPPPSRCSLGWGLEAGRYLPSAAMKAMRMNPAPIPMTNQAKKSSRRIPRPTPTRIPPTKAGPP
jgi:hypothetical protein